MHYYTYTDGHVIHLIFSDGVRGVDSDAIEFGHVYLKGYLDLSDDTKWNRFAGQESFFILMLNEPYQYYNLKVHHGWDTEVDKVVQAIIESIPQKNQRTSVGAIFGEIDPEGNGG